MTLSTNDYASPYAKFAQRTCDCCQAPSYPMLIQGGFYCEDCVFWFDTPEGKEWLDKQAEADRKAEELE